MSRQNEMIEQAQAAARRAFELKMNNPGCGVLISMGGPVKPGHRPNAEEVCAAMDAFGRELERLHVESN